MLMRPAVATVRRAAGAEVFDHVVGGATPAKAEETKKSARSVESAKYLVMKR
jgi:hypothetical protein